MLNSNRSYFLKLYVLFPLDPQEAPRRHTISIFKVSVSAHALYLLLMVMVFFRGYEEIVNGQPGAGGDCSIRDIAPLGHLSCHNGQEQISKAVSERTAQQKLAKGFPGTGSAIHPTLMPFKSANLKESHFCDPRPA
jgi:hypothetical protein